MFIMKKLFRSGLLALAAAAGLTGCLKDQGYTDLLEAKGAEPIVSIFGGDGGALRVVSFVLDTAKTVTYSVNVGSPNLLDKDVTITLGESTDGLADQNAKRTASGDTPYSALPKIAYTISPNPVVIKAGQRDAEFKVTVKVPKTPRFLERVHHSGGHHRCGRLENRP